MKNPEPASRQKTGVLLMAHGAPGAVEDIPAYLRNVRGGKEPSPEIVEAIAARYRAIGGASPLDGITRAQALALERLLNRETSAFRVYYGMRNWTPYIRDAVAQAARDGVEKLIGICLAPHYSSWSTGLYAKAFRQALPAGHALEPRFIASWPEHPGLIDAFAASYQAAAEKLRQMGKERFFTIFTAHSIPAESLDYGDPYMEEYEKTVRRLAARINPEPWRMAFQSQGYIPVPWLGPTVQSIIDEGAREGHKTILLFPVGFVADHVETLYDIDIDFKNYAASKNMELYRPEALNLSPDFIGSLAALVWENLC